MIAAITTFSYSALHGLLAHTLLASADRQPAHRRSHGAHAHLAQAQDPGLRRLTRWSLSTAGARWAGGQAWLLGVQPQDKDESAAFQALFDRSADYDAWLAELAQARQTLDALNVAELNRLLRRFERSYQALRQIDFFPSETSLRAQTQQRDFANAIESLQSPGEPRAAEGGIARRDPMRHQGRLWATRRHIWVDRVACAWLIQRFIDPSARFLWLENPAECPADALGFDFDGATFTHVGDRVSFEVLLASFGLEENRGLARLAALVHALDVGGAAPPEAAGFDAMLAGARKRWSDDDTLLAEAGAMLDSLYAHFSGGRKA